MQALVECEGDSIDLSGDMGAVGRVVISDTPSGNHEMYLDLKGWFCSNPLVTWVDDDPSAFSNTVFICVEKIPVFLQDYFNVP